MWPSVSSSISPSPPCCTSKKANARSLRRPRVFSLICKRKTKSAAKLREQPNGQCHSVENRAKRRGSQLFCLLLFFAVFRRIMLQIGILLNLLGKMRCYAEKQLAARFQTVPPLHGFKKVFRHAGQTFEAFVVLKASPLRKPPFSRTAQPTMMISLGKCVIVSRPFSVTTTTSSMRTPISPG